MSLFCLVFLAEKASASACFAGRIAVVEERHFGLAEVHHAYRHRWMGSFGSRRRNCCQADLGMAVLAQRKAVGQRDCQAVRVEEARRSQAVAVEGACCHPSVAAEAAPSAEVAADKAVWRIAAVAGAAFVRSVGAVESSPLAFQHD